MLMVGWSGMSEEHEILMAHRVKSRSLMSRAGNGEIWRLDDLAKLVIVFIISHLRALQIVTLSSHFIGPRYRRSTCRFRNIVVICISTCSPDACSSHYRTTLSSAFGTVSLSQLPRCTTAAHTHYTMNSPCSKDTIYTVYPIQ
ncbi:hypothetical protein PMIN06_008822 [Paraphaeosphaeria minitans]